MNEFKILDTNNRHGTVRLYKKSEWLNPITTMSATSDSTSNDITLTDADPDNPVFAQRFTARKTLPVVEANNHSGRTVRWRNTSVPLRYVRRSRSESVGFTFLSRDAARRAGDSPHDPLTPPLANCTVHLSELEISWVALPPIKTAQ
jgi:hypothetical protein